MKDYATNKLLPKFVSKKQAKQAFAVMNWDDHKSDPNVEFEKWFKESAFWKRPNYEEREALKKQVERVLKNNEEVSEKLIQTLQD